MGGTSKILRAYVVQKVKLSDDHSLSGLRLSEQNCFNQLATKPASSFFFIAVSMQNSQNLLVNLTLKFSGVLVVSLG